MKGALSNSFSPQSSLYIPHGSDESLIIQLINSVKNLSLYPTWFRWKRWYWFDCSIPCLLYIPHGSDEREKEKNKKSIEKILYIPHGSDESETWRDGHPKQNRLYIPHGSDESQKQASCLRSSKLFISHMVQMKGWILRYVSLLYSSFISHMVQMKETILQKQLKMRWTLYPTWFRWKYWKQKCNWGMSFPLLYIPHGSDESWYTPLFSLPLAIPLYPTWFRWKRQSCKSN